MSSLLMDGRAGSVTSQLGQYSLRHPDVDPAMRRFFESLARQGAEYERETDRLFPIILGLSEDEYRKLLSEISQEYD